MVESGNGQISSSTCVIQIGAYAASEKADSLNTDGWIIHSMQGSIYLLQRDCLLSGSTISECVLLLTLHSYKNLSGFWNYHCGVVWNEHDYFVYNCRFQNIEHKIANIPWQLVCNNFSEQYCSLKISIQLCILTGMASSIGKAFLLLITLCLFLLTGNITLFSLQHQV